MEKKNWMRTALKIIIIVLVVGFSIVLTIGKNSSSQEGKINTNNFESLIKKANIKNKYIHVNNYQNNLKYILFENLNDKIVNIILYENDRCQISYHDKDDVSNLGYYKVINNQLIIYNYNKKEIESYQIANNGIKANYNGYVFLVNPS